MKKKDLNARLLQMDNIIVKQTRELQEAHSGIILLKNRISELEGDLTIAQNIVSNLEGDLKVAESRYELAAQDERDANEEYLAMVDALAGIHGQVSELANKIAKTADAFGLDCGI